VEDEEARGLLRQIVERETELQKARGSMELGFRDGSGALVAASSVVLANNVRTSLDPALRRASFDGLRSIEGFALDHGFLEIVKLRNRFARRLGYVDYYDYKGQWAEGFDKRTLFGFLDDLESRTRTHAASEIAALRAREGDDAAHPWNFAFHSWGGDLQARRDPYFRFEDAPERWVRSFAAQGIRFRNARVTLDLVDRAGKYENGFMHGPTPAFMQRGTWLPAEINFTANALPTSSGAGGRAAQTLFHEGGHAAHFANIVTDAPCFSQESAPTSVALAETQSMFCDRLLDDADWRTRYALDESGRPMPRPLIEDEIRATHPFAAQNVRNMLVVCYAEKALYELPESELTARNVLRSFRDVEARITQLPLGCPRPTLAVPHLLSFESSAYYHGYVLATMAVAATREHLREKHGHLLDNPAIGRELGEIYWRPGNSRPFLDLVREMTGREFSADALVREVSQPTEAAIRRAADAVEELDRIPEGPRVPELDLRLRVIHGAETVVEETTDALAAAREFRRWVLERWPRAAPVA
jgi:Zn-dependent oligopeptidase